MFAFDERSGIKATCLAVLALMVVAPTPVHASGDDDEGGGGPGTEGAGQNFFRDEFSVDVEPSSGTFQTSMPIQVPEFRGIEPRLSLAYSSSGGNGLAGVGWRIAGLSKIERITPGGGSPSYDAQDTYALDGQELIGGCTILGGNYCPRIQSFERIEKGAVDWVVTQKDGTKRIYKPLMDDGSDTFRWALDTVRDTHGNEVSYAYDCPSSSEECYPDTISYNGVQIVFGLESRPDLIDVPTGRTLRTMDSRLRSVEVRVGPDRARRYVLGYNESQNGGRSLLAMVQHFGEDDTEKFPDLVPAYEDAPGGTFDRKLDTISGYPTSSGGNPAEILSGDYDGDGFTDLLYILDPAELRVLLAQGDGQFSERTTSTGTYPAIHIGHWIGGDFDGDGCTDVAHAASGGDVWIWYSDCDGTFTRNTADTSGVPPPANKDKGRWFAADFNGDGRTDLAHADIATVTNKLYIWASQPTRFDFIVSDEFPGVSQANRGWWLPGDLNGDGNSDIVHLQEDLNVLHTYISDGNFGFDHQTQTQPTGYPAQIRGGKWRVGDFNGDGRTDLFHIAATNGILVVWYSHGRDDFSWQQLALPSDYTDSTPLSTLSGWWFPIELNGDGRADLYHIADEHGDPGDLRLWQSTGAPGNFDFSKKANPGPTTEPLLFGGVWQSGDFNGDGRDDLVHFIVSDSFWSWLATGQDDNRLVSVTNRTGGTTTVGYLPSTEWPRTGYLPVGMITHTVSTITTDDGLGNTHTVMYEYEDALWSSRERCFLGFGTIRKYLEGVKPGNYEETSIRQVDNCTNRPEFIYKRDSQDRIFSFTGFVYDEEVATPPYRALERERREHECNQINTTGSGCRVIRTDTFYDEGLPDLTYANVTRKIEYGVLGLPSTERTERTTLLEYFPNTTDYVVDRVARERIFEGVVTDDGSSLTPAALTELLYDGNTGYQMAPGIGELSVRRRWDDHDMVFRETRFEYDSPYGNLTREVDDEGRGRRIEYDAAFHIFPEKTCDDPVLPPATPLIPCRTTQWDEVHGVPLHEFDPNGAHTKHQYDKLGRRRRTIFPDLTEQTVDYFGEGSPGGSEPQRVEIRDPDHTVDGLMSTMYIDGFGREWKAEREGGTTKLTEYHENTDRVERESVWFDPTPAPDGPEESAAYRVFEYDGAKRLTQVTEPYTDPEVDGPVTSAITYNPANDGSVTRTDTLGHFRTTFTDGLGRTSQVRERENGVDYDTFFAYDVLDNLTGVTDSAGNQASFDYDSLSQKRLSCDFDIDHSTCQVLGYDAGGLLNAQTNARGQLTQMTHDVLGRIETRTAVAEGELTSWFYDEAGHGESQGRLTRVTYPGGSQSFDWDEMGFQTSITRCVGSDCRTVQQNFVDGRIDTLTYPDLEVLTHGYDEKGFLASVTSSVSGTVVTGLAHDARGRLTDMTHGNGVTTTQGYRYPQDVIETVAVGTSGSVYQATYSYNAASQIELITSSTHDALNLDLDYDELYRLKTVVPSVVGKGQTQTFTYDAIGNLRTRDGMTYEYTDTTRPHAVTSAGGKDYAYDADGHLVSVTTRTPTCIAIDRLLQYDSLGRLRWASDGSQTTRYGYDHEGQRIEKRGGGSTTAYFGNLLEVTTDAAGTTSVVKYYYAEGRLVAREEAGQKQYVHQDHLGSVRAITDGTTGDRLVAYEYAAFGEQIETLGGTSTNVRAYGAHWRDDESGLLYMGARYHDPVLSRFLAPDPVVPEPEDPQSWNRYSFLRNNPFNRVDPTGRQDEEAQEDDATGDGSVGGVDDGSRSSPVGFDGVLADAGAADAIADVPTLEGKTFEAALAAGAEAPGTAAGEGLDSHAVPRSPIAVLANELMHAVRHGDLPHAIHAAESMTGAIAPFTFGVSTVAIGAYITPVCPACGVGVMGIGGLEIWLGFQTLSPAASGGAR